MFKQYEIWWVDLEPTKGSETRKKRPCVVLQASLMNRNSKTVVVAPILPGHKNWPFAVDVTPSTKNGLDKDRHINVKQMRAVDVSRFSNRQGVLEPKYAQPIRAALGVVFGL